jgi:uncharacterized protein YbbK (DUF523 family)
MTVQTAVDLTDRFEAYARARVDALARERLSGYVLKKGSPSCGLDGVPLYGAQDGAAPTGRGLFAARLAACYPSLPMEDEDRLSDPDVRRRFIDDVFAYARRAPVR